MPPASVSSAVYVRSTTVLPRWIPHGIVGDALGRRCQCRREGWEGRRLYDCCDEPEKKEERAQSNTVRRLELGAAMPSKSCSAKLRELLLTHRTLFQRQLLTREQGNKLKAA